MQFRKWTLMKLFRGRLISWWVIRGWVSHSAGGQPPLCPATPPAWCSVTICDLPSFSTLTAFFSFPLESSLAGGPCVPLLRVSVKGWMIRGFWDLVRMFTPTIEQSLGWVWDSRLEIIFPQSFEGVVSPSSSSFQDCLEVQSLSVSWSVYVTWSFCSEALICPLSQYYDIWQWTGFCMASVELDVL